MSTLDDVVLLVYRQPHVFPSRPVEVLMPTFAWTLNVPCGWEAEFCWNVDAQGLLPDQYFAIEPDPMCGRWFINRGKVWNHMRSEIRKLVWALTDAYRKDRWEPGSFPATPRDGGMTIAVEAASDWMIVASQSHWSQQAGSPILDHQEERASWGAVTPAQGRDDLLSLHGDQEDSTPSPSSTGVAECALRDAVVVGAAVDYSDPTTLAGHLISPNERPTPQATLTLMPLRTIALGLNQEDDQ